MRSLPLPPLALYAVIASGACGFRIDPGAAGGDATGGGVDAPAPLGDAGAADGGMVDAAVAMPDAGGDCIETTISASKSYGFVPLTLDGFLVHSTTYDELVLPPTLAVVQGNAGNHCALVALVRASDGAIVRCRYRGGADVAHVGSDPVQIAKGQQYVFDACARGSACPTLGGVPVTIAAGDRVAVLAGAQLSIGNGDDRAGTTVVRQTFRRCR